MGQRFKPRFTYANVMSSIAVFVALGGSAVATGHLVTSQDIQNRAVTTQKLGNGAVTPHKLRNQSVRPIKLARNAVFPAHIRNNAVRPAKIAPGAVISSRLADSSVLTDKISPGAVSSTRLADGSVIRQKLGSGAVGTGQLGDGAVATPKIADGAVATPKIADGAVTDAKLDNPVRWAHIRSQGQISKAKGVVGVSWEPTDPAAYNVEFDADMAACTFQVTPYVVSNARIGTARNDRDNGEFAEVRIWNADGNPAGSEFQIAAFC